MHSYEKKISIGLILVTWVNTCCIYTNHSEIHFSKTTKLEPKINESGKDEQSNLQILYN